MVAGDAVYTAVHSHCSVVGGGGCIRRTQGLHHEQVILFLTPKFFGELIMDAPRIEVSVGDSYYHMSCGNHTEMVPMKGGKLKERLIKAGEVMRQRNRDLHEALTYLNKNE